MTSPSMNPSDGSSFLSLEKLKRKNAKIISHKIIELIEDGLRYGVVSRVLDNLYRYFHIFLQYF